MRDDRPHVRIPVVPQTDPVSVKIVTFRGYGPFGSQDPFDFTNQLDSNGNVLIDQENGESFLLHSMSRYLGYHLGGHL